MAASPDPLPDDIAAAHALILKLSADLAAKDEALANRDIEMARLTTLLKKFQRLQFGKKSERLNADQMSLGLEDISTSIGMAEADEEARNARRPASRGSNRGVKRGGLPAHLPRIEQVIEIEDKSCPCCAHALHVIGEDSSERLDVIPAQFRVLVTRRPKYACRACTDGVHQAPAPPRLVEGGLPTEALIAHLIVGKYADHLPLYRQPPLSGKLSPAVI